MMSASETEVPGISAQEMQCLTKYMAVPQYQVDSEVFTSTLLETSTISSKVYRLKSRTFYEYCTW